jgi:hypothetical protein
LYTLQTKNNSPVPNPITLGGSLDIKVETK